METNPWKSLSSEVKYDNKWIRVTEHQVINPAGREGIYGVVQNSGRTGSMLFLELLHVIWGDGGWLVR
jgi:hypothetical protein